MSIGTDLRADLRSELLRSGRALTITRSTPGAYNESTGGVGATSTVTKTGLGRVGDYRDNVIDGTLIQVGDRRVTFQPDDAAFVPSVTDKILIDGRIAAVMSVRTREMEGDWICYTLQVR